MKAKKSGLKYTFQKISTFKFVALINKFVAGVSQVVNTPTRYSSDYSLSSYYVMYYTIPTMLCILDLIAV